MSKADPRISSSSINNPTSQRPVYYIDYIWSRIQASKQLIHYIVIGRCVDIKVYICSCILDIDNIPARYAYHITTREIVLDQVHTHREVKYHIYRQLISIDLLI